MKVLEKGRPQAGWSVEAICTGSGNGGGGCGARLLVEAGDLYKTHRYCRDEHDVFITFSCPDCGVETDLKDTPPRKVTEGLPNGCEEWLDRKNAGGVIYSPGTK